jgi:putative restriction endonuclease
MHARNRIIVEVAHLLGRTPSSLAMKLVNFASLDPEQRARGIRGLAGHSRADEQVWKEFGSNWEQMTLFSATSLGRLRMGRAQAGAEVVSRPPHDDIATEAVRSVKTRTMQGFFRKVVLAAYGSKCCITGNPVEGLLVASHILPWADFPAERLNPKNGLCLAAYFDRGFDCGLIAFDRYARLVVSPALRSDTPNEAIESEFIPREGQPIGLPERFSPHADFLDYHRSKIFRAV